MILALRIGPAAGGPGLRHIDRGLFRVAKSRVKQLRDRTHTKCRNHGMSPR